MPSISDSDTPSYRDEHRRHDEHRIAALAGLAIVIHVIEGLLPSPIPGVKPGLANVITLLAWQCFGLRVALTVTVLRVTVGSVILGSFMGPGFWLALAGAGAALLALVALAPIRDHHLGIIGRSTAMALAHISAQLAVATMWLLPGTQLWALWAPLAAAALVTGVVTGVVAARLLRVGGCGPADLRADDTSQR